MIAITYVIMFVFTARIYRLVFHPEFRIEDRPEVSPEQLNAMRVAESFLMILYLIAVLSVL